MGSPIADLITFHPRPSCSDVATADQSTIRESFFLTTESGQICARILQRLSHYPEPHPGAMIFTGDQGVGKSHVLRYLGGLVETPTDKEWESLRPYLTNDLRPRQALKSLFISVPEDPSIDLGSHLVESLSGNSLIGKPRGSTPSGALALGEFSAQMARAAQELAGRSLGILAVEDLPHRLEGVAEKEWWDRQFVWLKALTEAFSERGVLVLLILDDKHLKRERDSSGSPSPLLDLTNSGDFIWLSRNNIAEIIASHVATKDDNQRSEIRGILNHLRQKLSHLTSRTETFTDIYPIHPNVFNATFHLRSILPAFSTIRFTQATIPKALSRPAEKLITLDSLFDYVLPDLRAREEYAPVLKSYDELVEKVVPELKSSVQDRARLLLKGIAFLTISDFHPPSVKFLAHSLLLYDESGRFPGYSLASTVLMALEGKAARFLLMEGDNLDRKYRLVDPDAQTGYTTAKELLKHEEAVQFQLPLMICDWLYEQMPAWKLDSSSKSWHKSQSLMTSIQRDGSGPKGMVHFKSVVDPAWSVKDLAALEESDLQWVVLILSPLERLYELDPSLRELAANSTCLLIWRPDAPTPKELERIRILAATWHSPGDGKNDKAKAAHKRARGRARLETQEILTTLYIDRGLFIAAGDEWCPGEEAQNQSLEQYLDQQLSRLAKTPEKLPKKQRKAREDVSAPGEAEVQALLWAAYLCGQDQLQTASIEVAESSVLNWWSELEAAGLNENLRSLPDAFLTTRFWDEIKSSTLYAELLERAFTQVRNRNLKFTVAMAQVARVFNHDEGRLKSWKTSVNNLAGLLRWLVIYKHAHDYLDSAVRTNQEGLEKTRAQLLDQLDKPQSFLEPAQRESFERDFLNFKKGYADYYYSMHEDALNIVGASEKMESKVDYIALRNLELLSNLHYTDKSYLNRVRIIGKWVQANQCNLPVRDILERYPRCYCNFNPAGNNRIAESVAQLNAVIQEGIRYFRTILRNRKVLIIQEMKVFQVDDYHAKQIAALFGGGPMIPLKPQCVGILNRIIEKYSTEFLTDIRAYSSKADTSAKA